jgi:hypothetical protein
MDNPPYPSKTLEKAGKESALPLSEASVPSLATLAVIVKDEGTSIFAVALSAL